MKERFADITFRAGTLKVIEQADKIIREYQARGYMLTLRQLYYQFVSRDLLPNLQSEYKRLGKIINDARMAGRLDWAAIEDRTRNVKTSPAWSSPAQIIRAVAQQYQEDLWVDQPARVEVWIEKDALMGVIERVCTELRVPYFACRGYVSQSEAYDAGKRLYGYQRHGQKPIILHLGDHDPSGLDMTRDLSERLSLLARCPVDVRRLALNMEQIEEHDPPPNPAKDTDARFAGYQEEFGDSSWELDALDPDVISDLIQTELDGIIDSDEWAKKVDDETENKADLQTVYEYWSEVSEFAKSLRDDDSTHGGDD